MLSFTGKKNDTKIFGNSLYRKCEGKDRIIKFIMAMTLIFLRFIIITPVNNICFFMLIMSNYVKICLFNFFFSL